MLTVTQKTTVATWISNQGAGFDSAFNLMKLLSGAFGMSGSDSGFASEISDHLDALKESGEVKSCPDWCGRVYWRA